MKITLTAAAALLALAACTGDDYEETRGTHPDVQPGAEQGEGSLGAYAKMDHPAFVAAVRSEIAAIDRELEGLRHRIETAAGEPAPDVQSTLQELPKERDEVIAQLQSLDGAQTAEASREERREIVEQCRGLRRSIEELRQKIG